MLLREEDALALCCGVEGTAPWFVVVRAAEEQSVHPVDCCPSHLSLLDVSWHFLLDYHPFAPRARDSIELGGLPRASKADILP